MRPYRDTSPYVGVSPATPQKLAGHEIEPPVLSAKAMCGMRSAFTSPAAPPDEPPHVRPGSIGFFGTSKPEFTENVPKPNSSWFVLPTTFPPAALVFLTHVASKNGTKYYPPDCAGADRISDANKVWFISGAAAMKAGYEPAANCKGL